MAERKSRLLEDLDVSDLSVDLAAELALLVEEVLNQGLVVSAGEISLAPGVGVDVLAHVGGELRGTLSAADEEAAVDLGLVVLTEGDDDTKGVLASSLETLGEATGQVGGHEHLGEILVVLVVSEPEGPSIGLVVLPEPGKDSSADVLGVVGVDALELLEVELGGGEEIERIGGLLGGLVLVLLISGSGRGVGGSGGGGGGSSGGGLGLVDGHLSAQGERSGYRDEVGLTNDGGEPAQHVSEGLAELGVEEHLHTGVEGGAEDDIGQSDGLSNQEGAGQQAVVQGGQKLNQISLSSLSGLVVVLEVAEDGVQPDSSGGVELGGPVDPGINHGSLIGGSSIEHVSLTSNILGDGIALPDGSVGSLHSGNLVQPQTETPDRKRAANRQTHSSTSALESNNILIPAHKTTSKLKSLPKVGPERPQKSYGSFGMAKRTYLTAGELGQERLVLSHRHIETRINVDGDSSILSRHQSLEGAGVGHVSVKSLKVPNTGNQGQQSHLQTVGNDTKHHCKGVSDRRRTQDIFGQSLTDPEPS